MPVTSGRPEGNKHYFTLIYGSYQPGVKPVMPKENLELNLKACMTQLLQKRWDKGIESWDRPDSEPQKVYLFAELSLEDIIVNGEPATKIVENWSCNQNDDGVIRDFPQWGRANTMKIYQGCRYVPGAKNGEVWIPGLYEEDLAARVACLERMLRTRDRAISSMEEELGSMNKTLATQQDTVDSLLLQTKKFEGLFEKLTSSRSVVGQESTATGSDWVSVRMS